ncbi:MAG: mechanosensitive ion channel family protein, partial [Chitinophagaceae bacterium]
GIGLGLQGIVGNLFSGIILAFERPFEIGDQIEVDNRRGRVKEMGFRSSRIITFEGSEVIVPNGDLLSHHVINYTLSNNFTRVELMVGVKYGTDLEKTKLVLEEMLRKNIHVRQFPAPQVLLHAFNESSVDVRLLFWTDISIWVELKSEIILAVDKAFREAGIEIPYPQLDIHIISSSGSMPPGKKD